MSNSKTKRTTVKSVMGRSEFRAGFDDYRNGKKMRDDWSGRDRSHVCKQQWSYERGRLLAVIASTKGLGEAPLKFGRNLNNEMVAVFAEAIREKMIL